MRGCTGEVHAASAHRFAARKPASLERCAGSRYSLRLDQPGAISGPVRAVEGSHAAAICARPAGHGGRAWLRHGRAHRRRHRPPGSSGDGRPMRRAPRRCERIDIMARPKRTACARTCAIRSLGQDRDGRSKGGGGVVVGLEPRRAILARYDGSRTFVTSSSPSTPYFSAACRWYRQRLS